MRNATAFAFFLNRVSDTNYVKKATEITDSMWPFVLETSEDLVVMNGTVQSVGQLIKDKQKLDSSVKIAYHTIGAHNPDSATLFQISQTHKICFIAEKENQGSKAQTFALQVPLKCWNTNVTQVLWQVRWTTKGLTPIKPAIYTMVNIELPPGRCISLDAEEQ